MRSMAKYLSWTFCVICKVEARLACANLDHCHQIQAINPVSARTMTLERVHCPGLLPYRLLGLHVHQDRSANNRQGRRSIICPLC